jgi:hypothetical protein
LIPALPKLKTNHLQPHWIPFHQWPSDALTTLEIKIIRYVMKASIVPQTGAARPQING